MVPSQAVLRLFKFSLASQLGINSPDVVESTVCAMEENPSYLFAQSFAICDITKSHLLVGYVTFDGFRLPGCFG